MQAALLHKRLLVLLPLLQFPLLLLVLLPLLQFPLLLLLMLLLLLLLMVSIVPLLPVLLLGQRQQLNLAAQTAAAAQAACQQEHPGIASCIAAAGYAASLPRYAALHYSAAGNSAV
jgi:hypothetical protein